MPWISFILNISSRLLNFSSNLILAYSFFSSSFTYLLSNLFFRIWLNFSMISPSHSTTILTYVKLPIIFLSISINRSRMMFHWVTLLIYESLQKDYWFKHFLSIVSGFKIFMAFVLFSMFFNIFYSAYLLVIEDGSYLTFFYGFF